MAADAARERVMSVTALEAEVAALRRGLSEAEERLAAAKEPPPPCTGWMSLRYWDGQFARVECAEPNGHTWQHRGPVTVQGAAFTAEWR